MSSYRVLDLTAQPLLNAVAVSSTNTYVAGPINVSFFESTCFQCEWSTGFTGVISILGSIDGVNFRSFGATVSAQPADGASGVLIPIFGSGMKWLQVSYTNATGSGTLTVTALCKTR